MHYIVTEDINRSLFKPISRIQKFHGNRFPEYIAGGIFEKLVEAVDELHSNGYAFVNLSPDHIFVGQNS